MFLAKRKMTKAEKTEAKWGLAFVTPTIIGLIVLNFYPIIRTIYMSFFKTGDFGKGNTFVGLQNYSAVLTSSEFWGSLVNTIKYAVIEVPFSIVIAMILAVLLNRKMKFRSGYRTIFFLPMVAAPAAVAMVWKWLYNQQYGLLNHVLGRNISWISDPKHAWIAVGVVGVWSIIGYNMVLFLGGLQEIPHDYYEAAVIDGASGLRQFFHITIPLVSPTTFFIVQTRIIAALQVFDLIYMMIDKTNVALKQTQSVVYVFYQYVFTYDNKGYGSTMIVLLLIFIMAITVVLQRAEKRFVFYN
ncbi:MAG: sugar ABC transporter permease [Eubacterium sp.]|nr:sugar ABC transporter permease [Eubacterium sp.]MBQ9061755.1 sugar ABC transporter permease [Eubacterium sp.]MBQ9322570.1 sugar ABC transporter permease [Eubacterium sp.]MBR0397796.1 sugar ABC transporter permease [Eubacterium sp.]